MPCDFTVWMRSWTGDTLFCLDLMCSVFSRPGTDMFVILVHRWNNGDFLFTTGLCIVFLAVSFQSSFFIWEWEKLHSKIIGYVEIMLTMCSAHCICFYGFKQDHFRSTMRTDSKNSLRLIRPHACNLRSGVIFFFLLCFFGSRGKKNNAWYIYLTSRQPPPNLHNLTSAWPVMLLANKRLPYRNQILARIMSLWKSILGKREFFKSTSMFRWRFLKKKKLMCCTASWSCRTFM